MRREEAEMTTFGAFVKKETLVILRDPVTVVTLFLIPVILMVMTGFALSTDISNIKVAVVIPHSTEQTRQDVQHLEATPIFNMVGVTDARDIDKNLRRGKADAVVMFGENGQKQIVVDASNPNTAALSSSYIQNAISAEATQALLSVSTHMLYNPQLKSSYTFVPGIMGMIFLLICAVMTSVSIVGEKERGSMDVLLISPIKPINIILAKMIPYLVLSCVDLATMLLLARFMLDVPMSGNLISIICISLLYLVLALSVGLLVSTLAKNQVTALIASMGMLLLPTIMLSGVVFPRESMPSILRALSSIVPATWYIDAVKKLMIQGLPFAGVLKQFTILLGMTLFMIVMSLRNFKEKD